MDRADACFDLQTVLAAYSERRIERKSTVLFRRGETSSGLFVIFSGKVSLDLGVNSPLSQTYGQGALLGLPATVTKQPYSMTATVMEDAELGFCSVEVFNSLLDQHPEVYQELIMILAEKVADNNDLTKALLNRDR